MRKISLAGLIFCASLLTTNTLLAAATETDDNYATGVYISASGGLSLLLDRTDTLKIDYDQPITIANQTFSASEFPSFTLGRSFYPGYNAELELGYQYYNWRYGLSGGYQSAQIKTFTAAGVTVASNIPKDTGDILSLDEFDVVYTPVLFNMYYDFKNINFPIKPFVGVGLGYGVYSEDYPVYLPVNQPTSTIGAFAYRLTGGLEYTFAHDYTLSLSTAYLGSASATWKDQVAGIPVQVTTRYSNFTVDLGFRILL